MSRRFWLPLLTSLLLTLSGCGIFGEEEDKTRDWSAQKLYTEAGEAMSVGDFETAVDLYEKLEARYPFGKYAMQSQLNVAYAYYRFSEPESALAAVERFIKLYPNNPAAAYALYLKGLINFNRSLSFMDRFIPTDTSQRDPAASIQSYKDFAELVRRFPATEYAEDARQRMVYLRNNLARHEVHVASYYLDRGAFLAAANRAKYVVENYQRTPAVKPALEIMIEAYRRLELPELAADAQRVLALNEAQGNFIPDPQDLEEKSWAREIWDYTGLDED
jgi:outer membrane protein assembly factor BamD